jgi:beta-glucosidase
VTNTGKREGDEIVQVYVRVNGSRAKRPTQQLVNFDRIHLAAGETKPMSLDLAYDHNALRYWDEKKNEFVVDPGTAEIMAGASSADIRLRREIQLTA